MGLLSVIEYVMPVLAVFAQTSITLNIFHTLTYTIVYSFALWREQNAKKRTTDTRTRTLPLLSTKLHVNKNGFPSRSFEQLHRKKWWKKESQNNKKKPSKPLFSRIEFLPPTSSTVHVSTRFACCQSTDQLIQTISWSIAAAVLCISLYTCPYIHTKKKGIGRSNSSHVNNEIPAKSIKETTAHIEPPFGTWHFKMKYFLFRLKTLLQVFQTYHQWKNPCNHQTHLGYVQTNSFLELTQRICLVILSFFFTFFFIFPVPKILSYSTIVTTLIHEYLEDKHTMQLRGWRYY